MLKFEHKAAFLYREDAYREFSFSTDAYGSYQPASFIYLSFESLKDYCITKNINIYPDSSSSLNSNEKKSEPHPWKYEQNKLKETTNFDGLIIRVLNQNHVNLIEDRLEKGQNVLALIPREVLKSWFNNNEKYVSEYENVWKLFSDKTFSECDFDWIEIIKKRNGRLFIAHDDFLSDGSFFKGYGTSNEKTERIDELIRELSKYKYPKFGVEFKNTISEWICGEPIDFIFDIINYSEKQQNIEIKVELSNTFEPISSIEFYIKDLSFLGRQTLAFKTIPRVVGDFKDFIKIDINNSILVKSDLKRLIIKPSYNQLYRNQYKKDDKDLSILTKLANTSIDLEEIKNISDLYKVDLKACLNKIRTVTEKLCYIILDLNNISLNYKNLNNAINKIKSRSILTQKSVGYLHAIRLAGNVASHPSDEKLSETDVQMASFALASFIEELIDKGLIRKT